MVQGIAQKEKEKCARKRRARPKRGENQDTGRVKLEKNRNDPITEIKKNTPREERIKKEKGRSAQQCRRCAGRPNQYENGLSSFSSSSLLHMLFVSCDLRSCCDPFVQSGSARLSIRNGMPATLLVVMRWEVESNSRLFFRSCAH